MNFLSGKLPTSVSLGFGFCFFFFTVVLSCSFTWNAFPSPLIYLTFSVSVDKVGGHLSLCERVSLGRSALCRLCVPVALTGGWEVKRVQAKRFSWHCGHRLDGGRVGLELEPSKAGGPPQIHRGFHGWGGGLAGAGGGGAPGASLLPPCWDSGE